MPNTADEVDVDMLVTHGGQIHRHLQQAGDDLAAVIDDFIGGLAQAFMDHGDGLYTTLRLFRLTFGLGLTCLQSQRCGNRLKVVLDAMVDFGNRRILGLQFLFTTAKL